jgi:hypothetical protein
MRDSDFFRPGERIVRSGIYDVTHDQAHVHDHRVTCVFGNSFPKCNHCGDRVRFKLTSYAKDVDSENCFNLPKTREK